MSPKNTILLAAIAALFAYLVSGSDPVASGAIPSSTSQRIICDANAHGDVIEEEGQYGRVTAQTCYRGTFQGEEVRVYFVD
jgi:hypothetical protein